MKSVWKFRLLAIGLIILVGAISIANLIAEFARPSRQTFRTAVSKSPSPEQLSAAKLAVSIAPFRQDLKADYALLLTGKALNGDKDAKATAGAALKDALRIGPHDSEVWLGLALLQAQANSPDPRAADALKMSYLTGPNQAELMPVRLATVTSGTTLTDSDLRELAGADVRVILTQGSEGRSVLLGTYKRASEAGKDFIKD